MAEINTKPKNNKRLVIPKNLEKFPDFPKQKVDQSDSKYKSEVLRYWRKKKREKNIKSMRKNQKEKKLDRQLKIQRQNLLCCFPEKARHPILSKYLGISFEEKLFFLLVGKEFKHVCVNNSLDDNKEIKAKMEYIRATVSTHDNLISSHDSKMIKCRKIIFSNSDFKISLQKICKLKIAYLNYLSNFN